MHIVHFDENMLIGDAADLDAFMECMVWKHFQGIFVIIREKKI